MSLTEPTHGTIKIYRRKFLTDFRTNALLINLKTIGETYEEFKNAFRVPADDVCYL